MNKAPNKIVTIDTLAHVLQQNGVELYRQRSGYPLSQAQRNLERRTNYVDDKTIKFWKSKIISTSVLESGLIFGLIESLPTGPSEQEAARVFRPVFFDVFGNVIYKPDLENSFKTSKQAQASFWAQAEQIDAIKATLDGAEQKRNLIKKDLDDYDAMLKDLGR